jgi:CxxC-x17-CxxC domain-containing protein
LFRGNLRLNELRFMVIDEADEMFDEGFGPDVDQLLDCILQRPQMALFSATIPKWVESIAERKLKEAVTVKIDGKGPVESVEHTVITVPDGQKIRALGELLDGADGSSVVFCRTKDGVERLTGQLSAAGYVVAGLRGNMTQPERERVMRGFRIGKPEILVATNVAARGLDVANIGRVINFDLPDSPELLTHRLGRAGRMGRAGEAMTLVTPKDRKRWLAMQSHLGLKVNERKWELGQAPDQPRSEPKTPTSRQAKPAGTGSSSVRTPVRRSALRRDVARPNGRQAENGHASNGSGRPADENGAASSGSRPQAKNGRVPKNDGRQAADSRNRTSWYEAVCDGCGSATKVPHEPSPQRAAYCRECYELVSMPV